MAARFCGLPAKAPFKSTKCRRRAPCASQCAAMSAGLSLKVVTWSMSPCFRRTQCPSFKSMAGMISMVKCG